MLLGTKFGSARCILLVGVILAVAAVAQESHKGTHESSGTPGRTAGFVTYRNGQYDFCFALPQDWKGYSVLRSDWSGLVRDSKGDVKPDGGGPMITIRHPSWTDVEPWQDIPIMVFTRKQWHSVIRGNLIVSAAGVGPQEIGRNGKYVFALPPRYTATGAIEAKGTWDVVKWISTRPLRSPCK